MPQPYRKFTFTFDSGERFGSCEEIVGLGERISADPEEETPITAVTLVGFELDKHFTRCSRRTRVQLESMRIVAQNRKGQQLTELYGAPSGTIDWRQREFEQGKVDWELDFLFSSRPSAEALQVWKLWENGLPLRANEWVDLSAELQSGWLEAVRIKGYSEAEYVRGDAPIEIDMRGVRDRNTFFLALGEAMIGPGGYYGHEALSLDDLLCCEPGLPAPDKLVLVYDLPSGGDTRPGEDLFLNQNTKEARELRRLFDKYGVTLTPIDRTSQAVYRKENESP
ncbi:hypothetical protein QWJ34_26420 [Saccharibacillus sp. CPCC 101409]|uniref:hypothetical protein n=1 Tax=Saccharibacillus sp. CPCC 101409 TaxID=3058041 RepID=UPI002672217A|nr:hypothetical protein [Saccharibacillus sp. CPCC 101409]MDO3413315.1 hypothetical protein [Saccharibacillus sp. CPCC 101409]